MAVLNYSDVAVLVVDRREMRQVLGVLRRSDLVSAYSHVLVDMHQPGTGNDKRCNSFSGCR